MRGTITASTEGIRFVQVTIAKHPPKVFLPEELEIINE
ncbi:hypothetical protein [Caudoviricetes sp.]|nr:hypothetical protein [Caudoviricetes sp.]